MAVFSAFPGEGDRREADGESLGSRPPARVLLKMQMWSSEDAGGFGTRGSFCLHEGAMDLLRWVHGHLQECSACVPGALYQAW